ncbi:sigma-54-dependent Fis family transcriptional regulator [Thermoflavimicrobium dichotomicum]|uniref:sigma-54-dependent Fis family transcriptional regulator n=1 Tax=Thermoflavimicrobium dichotomicum TaxID=46223 RepID=UPI0015877E6C|nr:sigma-54-dependent Fis family transcriptional regulator [Thermoflavimicrobium dichotomicum]
MLHESTENNAIIHTSWERSKTFGVDPDKINNELLTEGELRDRTNQFHDFFRTSTKILDRLYSQLKRTSFMILISDVDGYIIRSWGDFPFIEKAKKVWLDVGANWHERIKGTNAIGTALVEKKPVSVIGKQHYCRENHFLTCYASPLYSPKGELLGVLDISGDARNHQVHTLGMVIAAAQACQAHLLLESTQQELTFALQETETVFKGINQPLISVDESGIITRINQAAANLLEQPLERCIGQPLDRWFKESEEILSTCGPALKKITLKPNLKGKKRTWVAQTIQDKRRKKFRVVISTERSRDPFKPKKAENTDQLVYDCPKVKQVLEIVSAVAKTEASILIQGETGSGKEGIARRIHQESGREGPLITVNCAAIPEQLIESELFGYEQGAFTGARKDGQIGKFEAAHGGTLFLDEIGELPLSSQAVLLRVLEEKVVTRIGSLESKPVDVRIVAATNRPLAQEVQKKRFRADLYYRLCEFEISLPPLRERSDLLTLVDFFLKQVAQEIGINQFTLDHLAKDKIQLYHWPGNIRELRQVLRQAAYKTYFVHRSTVISAEELIFPQDRSTNLLLQSKEEEAVKQAIQSAKGNLSKAARMLGISRTTLYKKIAQYPQVKEVLEKIKNM